MGDSFFYRQYMVTGQFVDVVEQATPLVDQTEQLFQKEDQHREGSPVYICGEPGKELFVVLESCSPQVCVGSTRPSPGGEAFYHVRCGSSSYVGPDVYHFQPVADVHRPYVCNNEKSEPQWALLGFFDCEELA